MSIDDTDDDDDDVAAAANDDEDVMMMMMMMIMVIYLHNIIKGLRESQLGFYHAELSQVMTRVRILGTESRTESVDFRHSAKTKHSKEYLLTSLAVQFYLGFCFKSGMLAARLANCQCLCLSSLAVG